MAEDAATTLSAWANRTGYTPPRPRGVIDDWFAEHPDALEQLRIARSQLGWSWSACAAFLSETAGFCWTSNPLQRTAQRLGVS